MNRILLILSYFLAVSLMAFANPSDYINYNKRDGMASNTIERIEKDREGYIYFATNNGISVFDGTSFQTFNGQNTPCFSNTITAIRSLDSSRLLIGTLDKGLFVFDKKNDCIFPVKCSSEYPEHIVDIVMSEDGTIWIATLEGVVWYLADNRSLLKTKTARFIKIDYAFSTIYTLADYNGHILVGSYSGKIVSIARKNSQILIENICQIEDAKGIHSFMVHNRKLWVGTDNGIKQFSMHGNQLVMDYSCDLRVSVRAIAQIKNKVYVGTEGFGVGEIDLSTNTFKWVDYLSGKYIISLKGTTNNMLWVGTWGEGVYRLQLGSPFQWISNLQERASCIQNIVWSIYPKEEKNSYYIGTNGQGLCSYVRGEREIKLLSKAFPSIISFYNDTTSPYLYIGTWGKGIRFWDKKRQCYAPFTCQEIENDRVYAITRLKENHALLIGTSQSGVWMYDEQGKKMKRLIIPGSMKNLNVRAFLSKGKGYWMATYNGGLYYLEFDRDGRLTYSKRFPESDGRLLQIYHIYDDGDKLGLCLSDGVAFFDCRTQKIKRLPDLEGISVKSMLRAPGGSYWLASQSGIFHYHPLNRKTDCYLSNIDHYGLYYNASTGDMFSGSSVGMLSFSVREVSLIGRSDRALIRDLYIDGNLIKPGDELNKGYINRSINYSDTLKMASSNQTLGLRLSCFSENQGQNIELYYRIEGIDRSWNKLDAVGGMAIYSNLPAGHFLFKVRLYSPNNTLGERSIVILKSDYFWNTAYFKLFVVCLFLLSIAFYYRKKYLKKVFIVEKEKEEEVIQQKIRFFTNMSHDLKTPLTLLLSPLSDLKESAEMPQHFKERLSSMYANGELLIKKINRILNYRDYDEKDLNLYLESFPLHQLVYEICFPFKEYADRQGFLFHFEGVGEISNAICIQTDREKFESVLENLISNAIKYTQEGGEIVLDYEIIDNALHLKIRNKGEIIPQERLDQIFEKYYRIDQDNKGNGIGLFLVQKFVSQLKGCIEVQSSAEKGTEFMVVFPLTQEAFEDETSDQGVPKEISEEGNYTLLVVDDNLEMRLYLKELFSSDYKVILASDGVEALALIEENIPDLMITDLMMHDMDGVELCRQIKSNMLTSHIPIIVLSAKSALDARLQCLEIGVDSFETKPFNSKLLMAKTSTLIKNRRLLKYKYQLNPSNIDLNKFRQDDSESLDDKFIRQLNETINKHIDNPDLSVEILAYDLAMSHDQLYRKLKALTSTTVNQYIRSYRLNCAASMLKSKKYMVTEVLYRVGFNNPSYFTKCFKKEFGVLPSEYVDLN